MKIDNLPDNILVIHLFDKNDINLVIDDIKDNNYINDYLFDKYSFTCTVKTNTSTKTLLSFSYSYIEYYGKSLFFKGFPTWRTMTNIAIIDYGKDCHKLKFPKYYNEDLRNDIAQATKDMIKIAKENNDDNIVIERARNFSNNLNYIYRQQRGC